MVLLVQQIYANDDSIKHGYDRHPFSPECKPKNTPSRFMARVRWNVLLADNLVIFGVVTYPKPLRSFRNRYTQSSITDAHSDTTQSALLERFEL